MKEEKNFCASEYFRDYEKKVCSDETHDLTCDLVALTFPCCMYHATNTMKQGFHVALQLHLEIEQICNVAIVNEIRAQEVPINMDDKYGLFTFLRIQLQDFFTMCHKEIISKRKVIF